MLITAGKNVVKIIEVYPDGNVKHITVSDPDAFVTISRATWLAMILSKYNKGAKVMGVNHEKGTMKWKFQK